MPSSPKRYNVNNDQGVDTRQESTPCPYIFNTILRESLCLVLTMARTAGTAVCRRHGTRVPPLINTRVRLEAGHSRPPITNRTADTVTYFQCQEKRGPRHRVDCVLSFLQQYYVFALGTKRWKILIVIMQGSFKFPDFRGQSQIISYMISIFKRPIRCGTLPFIYFCFSIWQKNYYGHASLRGSEKHHDFNIIFFRLINLFNNYNNNTSNLIS